MRQLNLTSEILTANALLAEDKDRLKKIDSIIKSVSTQDEERVATKIPVDTREKIAATIVLPTLQKTRTLTTN